MTDKELRKLKRRDLLEILYDQAEEIERLEAENKELKQRLDDRRILVEKTGTMAEAALALNAVFEAADAAAKQYLENIRAGCREEGEAEAVPEDGSGGELKEKMTAGKDVDDSKEEPLPEEDVDDSKEEPLPGEGKEDLKKETLSVEGKENSKKEPLPGEDGDGFGKETPSEKVEKDSKKPTMPGESETGQTEKTSEFVPWIEE